MNSQIRVAKRINDSIHGFIEISDVELAVVDTPIFQRLRRIKQVSPADFVFPGATHTRFSHCLGAKFLMEQMLNHVKIEGQPIAENVDEQQKLRLAALLHDLGHFPLSHTGERAVKQLCNMEHEDFGVKLIKRFLTKELASYSIDEIAALIKGDKPNSVYTQVLSSNLDVDKLDYLLRDAYHAGVTYGQIDIQRIIRSMTFDKSNNMIFEKAGSVVENMLVGRYHLYQVINHHRAVTAFELMAQRIYYLLMKRGEMPRPDSLIDEGEGELDLITYDDALLAHAMVQYLRKKESGFLSDLIRMYLKREPLVVVWEGTRFTDKEDGPKEDEHLAIMVLDRKDMEKQIGELTSQIQKKEKGFTEDWLFPISLKPIRILPEDAPQIFVRKKGAKDPIPIEDDQASLIRMIGSGALYNSRLYTKPGAEDAAKPIFESWAKSDRVMGLRRSLLYSQ